MNRREALKAAAIGAIGIAAAPLLIVSPAVAAPKIVATHTALTLAQLNEIVDITLQRCYDASWEEFSERAWDRAWDRP